MTTIALTDLPLAIQLTIAGVVLLFAALTILPFILAAGRKIEESHPKAGKAVSTTSLCSAPSTAKAA